MSSKPGEGQTLWEEYEAFTKRDLSGFDVAYIFLDAVFEPMRMFKGPKEGILCAWAILISGEKVLLHMDLGNKESYDCWLEFLRDVDQPRTTSAGQHYH